MQLNNLKPAAGSKHAKRLENLRADFVLAAIATGRRRQRGSIPLPAIEHHQQRIVLIVGMRRRHHEDTGVAQMPQREAQRHVPLLFVHRNDTHLCARLRQRQGSDRQHRQRDAFHHGLYR